MKRKGEVWAIDPDDAANIDWCRPSLFQHDPGFRSCGGSVSSGNTNTTPGTNSNTSEDEASYLPSNPYIFMNFGGGTAPPRKRAAKSSTTKQMNSIVDLVRRNKDDQLQITAEEDGEKLLASEMQALSVNEREEIYEEIHGVGKSTEESPGFIQTKLRLLEQQLTARHQPKPKRGQQQSAAAKEPFEHPSAYQQALFLAPQYVKDPNFRLLFLRSESFDVIKAAAKFVKHFELKKRVFGVDKLGKAIDFSDLEEGDVEALRNGAFHMIPNFRTQNGRRAVFDNYYCYKDSNSASVDNQIRLIWYGIMRDIERDAEIQRKGIIGVLYAMGISSSEYTRAVIEQKKNAITTALPLVGICGHFCLDNPQLRPIFSIFLAAIPKWLRLRVRVHFGSDMECQYALSTYGITGDLLPYEADGSVKRDKMEQSINIFQTEDEKERANRVQQETSQNIALYATSLDVLVGKGMPYQNSKGTLRMLQLVEQSMPRYIAAKDDRFTKTTIFIDVIQVIKRDGGRFLKRHPDSGKVGHGGPIFQKDAACSGKIRNAQQVNKNDPDVWVVLDDEVAREKVAVAFRASSRRLRE